jgi:hypothetical protein
VWRPCAEPHPPEHRVDQQPLVLAQDLHLRRLRLDWPLIERALFDWALPDWALPDWALPFEQDPDASAVELQMLSRKFVEPYELPAPQ